GVHFAAGPQGCVPQFPLARRERRAYPVRPVRYVRSEQHRQRELRPAALRAAARRGAAASARPALAPKCTPYFLTGPKGTKRRIGPDSATETRRYIETLSPCLCG